MKTPIQTVIDNQQAISQNTTALFMLGIKMHELVQTVMPLYFKYQGQEPPEELKPLLVKAEEILKMYESNTLPNSKQVLDTFYAHRDEIEKLVENEIS